MPNSSPMTLNRFTCAMESHSAIWSALAFGICCSVSFGNTRAKQRTSLSRVELSMIDFDHLMKQGRAGLFKDSGWEVQSIGGRHMAFPLGGKESGQELPPRARPAGGRQ